MFLILKRAICIYVELLRYADDGALRLRKKAVTREHLVTEPSKSEAPNRLQCDPVVILPFALHLSFMVATAFFVMHVQVNPKLFFFSFFFFHLYHFLEIVHVTEKETICQNPLTFSSILMQRC